MTEFVQELTRIKIGLIKARQQVCTLRNQLAELVDDLQVLSNTDVALEDMCIRLEELPNELEEVEGVLDTEFPLDEYPSSDPKTWKSE